MLTPDSPHMANVFLLLFGSLMGWLFHVGLRRCLAPGSGTRQHLWPLVGWGAIWVLVLLLNATILASARASWTGLARLPVLTSRAAVAGAGNGAQVLLAGRAVAPGATPAVGSPAYVVEFDSEGRRITGTGKLAVGLTDGVEPVELPESAVRWDWRYQRSGHGRSFLTNGDPVVVLGTVRHGASLASADRGATLAWVEARLVRLGSAVDFAAAAQGQSQSLWLRLLTWASLVAAAAVAAVPVVAWVRLPA